MADLNNDDDQGYRKIKLEIQEVPSGRGGSVKIKSQHPKKISFHYSSTILLMDHSELLSSDHVAECRLPECQSNLKRNPAH